MLVDMTTLDIAGKNDVRLAVEHFLPMGVAQGPIVVVLRDQAGDGAGGVGLVSFAARRAGVQHADIQHSPHRWRVGGRKVIQHGRSGKALAVDRHAPPLQEEGLWLAVVEHADILGQRKCPSHFVGRIMVSRNCDYGNSCLAESDHLRHEKEARPMVLPVTIVEVAGNQDEGHRLVDGNLDKIFQGPAAGLADFVDGCAFVAFQASQRAVEVDIGGVKKLEHCFRGKLRPRG